MAAVLMLLRYVQPLPDDGYFCRNVVWAQVRSQLPDCYPGGNCC